MSILLKGAPVAARLTEQTKTIADRLRGAGVEPTLAILRVGERAQDLSYERGAAKKCAAGGVAVRSVALPENVTAEEYFAALKALNGDAGVHGILLLRPLPKQLSDERARGMLLPGKDVDGCTDASLAGVFTNSGTGFAPCTARAVMELLRFYGIPVSGKRAAVLGRSLIIGRPVSMLLMHENATVTVCHTRTLQADEIARAADIVVCAASGTEILGKEYFAPGQTVIDVGMGWSERKNKLCGNVLFEEAEPLVSAITPVPGGIGAVTSAVLALQTAEAAERSLI